MPQVDAPTRQRRWQMIAVVMLLAAVAAGCGADDGAPRSSAQDDALSLTDRLARYHDSLLAETNWLWANMLAAQERPRPESARCQAPNFDHRPVTLNEDERQQDSAVATLEQLDYADLLITQARSEWQKHCQSETPSANAAAYLKTRLEPAYSALERARAGVDARRQSEARGR